MLGHETIQFQITSWDSSPVSYLVVPLDQIRSENQNWTPKTHELERKADGCLGGDLSIYARARACNVFLDGCMCMFFKCFSVLVVVFLRFTGYLLVLFCVP